MLDNLSIFNNQEELNILKRTVASDVFHFIIVQYNHYTLVKETKAFLQSQFPNHAQKTFVLSEDDALDFIPALLLCENGFVFLENAEFLLNENYKSISIGLNQRRDKYSMQAIQLLTFLPDDVQILRDFKNLMPDVYSIVNPIIILKKARQDGEKNVALPDYIFDSYTNVEEALRDIQRIEERLKKLTPNVENLPLIIRLNFNLAASYRLVGKIHEAGKILESLKIKIPEKDLKNHALLDNELGIVHLDLGNLDLAKNLIQEAFDFNMKNLGADHPTTITSESNLGMVYRDLGNSETAKSYLINALDKKVKKIGSENPDLISTLSNLGMIYKDLGNFDEAENFIQNALKIAMNSYGESHPKTSDLLTNLGTIYYNRGDYIQAKKITEKALKNDIEYFGAEHPFTAIAYSNLGMIYQNLGNLSQAKYLLDKAHQLLQKSFGEAHPDTQTAYKNLMEVTEKQANEK
jgi:tetratricopeptide (TPR) repeat protein